MLLTLFHHSSELWPLNHKVNFDGVNKLIIVHPEVTSLDIRSELYTAWVQWVAIPSGGNAPFLSAMRYSGLDPIPGGFSGDIYFLINGWKLLVDLSKVAVAGVLYSDNYTTAYYTPEGVAQYPARVSSLVNTVTTIQNIITGTVPTPTEMGNAIWTRIIEGLTAEEMMRVMLAALAGKRQGLGTATEYYMGQDDITPRITLTPDVNGNGLPILNGAP